jgi:hypothetical protein
LLSLVKWLEHKQTKVCNSKVISNKRLKIDRKNHKSNNEAQIQEQDVPEATGKGSSAYSRV